MECTPEKSSKLFSNPDDARNRVRRDEKRNHARDEKNRIKYEKIIRSWGYVGELSEISLKPIDPKYHSPHLDDIKYPMLSFLCDGKFQVCQARSVQSRLKAIREEREAPINLNWE